MAAPPWCTRASAPRLVAVAAAAAPPDSVMRARRASNSDVLGVRVGWFPPTPPDPPEPVLADIAVADPAAVPGARRGEYLFAPVVAPRCGGADDRPTMPLPPRRRLPAVDDALGWAPELAPGPLHKARTQAGWVRRDTRIQTMARALHTRLHTRVITPHNTCAVHGATDVRGKASPASTLNHAKHKTPGCTYAMPRVKVDTCTGSVAPALGAPCGIRAFARNGACRMVSTQCRLSLSNRQLATLTRAQPACKRRIQANASPGTLIRACQGVGTDTLTMC